MFELTIKLTGILEKTAGIWLLINENTKPMIADSMTPTVVSSTKESRLGCQQTATVKGI